YVPSDLCPSQTFRRAQWNPPHFTTDIRNTNTTSPARASASAILRLRRSGSRPVLSSIASNPVSERGDMQQPLAQQRGEQRKQIDQRDAEQAARGRLTRLVRLAQHDNAL